MESYGLTGNWLLMCEEQVKGQRRHRSYLREWSSVRSGRTELWAHAGQGLPGLAGCVAVQMSPHQIHTTPFPQVVVYESTGFQGQSWEVSRDIYDLQQPEDSQSPHMVSVGSLRVLGGW